jgi:hypothetical protein
MTPLPDQEVEKEGNRDSNKKRMVSMEVTLCAELDPDATGFSVDA